MFILMSSYERDIDDPRFFYSVQDAQNAMKEDFMGILDISEEEFESFLEDSDESEVGFDENGAYCSRFGNNYDWKIVETDCKPIMEWQNYTLEFCPYCKGEVFIRARGVTRCPVCGKPLAPCTVCHDENGDCIMANGSECPYGCHGDESDEHKEATVPDMTTEELTWCENTFTRY